MIETSPKRSLVGWQFNKWLLGNKKTVVELFKVGVPILVAYLSEWQPWAKVLSVILGKLVLDTIQFYFKEVEVEVAE